MSGTLVMVLNTLVMIGIVVSAIIAVQEIGRAHV